MKTLEETIKHHEEIAEAAERSAKLHQRPDRGVKGSGKRYLSCIECAAEHRQLTEWLRELKAYREAREEIGCLPIVWKEDAGVRKCIGILDKHLMEVNSDEPQFPYIEGELAEMFVDDKWIRGRIVNGYRFRDGVVTIETDDGKRYWCGQDRTELYRPFTEVNADEDSR